MELPWLKHKNKNGSGTAVTKVPDQSNNDILMEQVGKELLEAMSRKDIKALREALYTLVNMIQEQDKEQDDAL